MEMGLRTTKKMETIFSMAEDRESLWLEVNLCPVPQATV